MKSRSLLVFVEWSKPLTVYLSDVRLCLSIATMVTDAR